MLIRKFTSWLLISIDLNVCGVQKVFCHSSGEWPHNGFELNTTATQFVVNLTLTDSGLEQFEEVLLAVFQYIYLLKSKGPLKQYFDEMKIVEETKFRFKEKGDAMDYVEKVSENMQIFSPEDVLTGRDLMYEYDPELIVKCLADLRGDNCCIFLSSKQLSDKCDRQDIKWSPVRYGVAEIKPEWIQKWQTPPKNPDLCLSQPNKSKVSMFQCMLICSFCFTATDFTIAEVEAKYCTKHPITLSENELCTLYYKKDMKFKVPKAYVCVQLMSPMASQSVKNQGLLKIFEAVMSHKLDAPTYPAIMAGFDYSINVDDTGLKFKVNGFNQKLPELFDLLLTAVFDYACNDELFPIMRHKVKREIFNAIIRPFELVRILRFSVIDPHGHYRPAPEIYSIIDSLTNEDLRHFLTEFRQSIKADILVVGNVTPKVNLRKMRWQLGIKRVESKLCGKVEPSKMYQRILYQLPKQWSYCQTNSFNMEDANSSITVYLQSDPGDIRSTVINELLDVTVISFSKDLVRVESLIAAKLTEDTQLEEEVNRYWGECKEQNYVFDRLEKEVFITHCSCTEDINRRPAELVQTVSGRKPETDKFIFQVLGNPEVEQVDGKSDKVEPPQKKANTDKCNREQGYVVRPVKDCNYPDHQCISDIQHLRSKLTMFDYHCITK
ncbi:nardilysin-like [Saccostrea echinata]|uniref:nardilysin-like n=1 Tax=Saccostrea echinata TaxID=191078 RepID=UPI002A81F906|nr:nardilysin-like [Saccostrea echinata]